MFLSSKCITVGRFYRYSKQAFLADVQQPYDLPDGTPSFKDYMGNKNNRFINPEMASKNRIQPPSKVCRRLCTLGSCLSGHSDSLVKNSYKYTTILIFVKEKVLELNSDSLSKNL